MDRTSRALFLAASVSCLIATAAAQEKSEDGAAPAAPAAAEPAPSPSADPAAKPAAQTKPAPAVKAEDGAPSAPAAKADEETKGAPAAKAQDSSTSAPAVKPEEEAKSAPEAKAGDGDKGGPAAKAEDSAKTAPALPAAPQAQLGQDQVEAQPPKPAPMPDAHRLNLIIRSTVIAVNQANKTGNYSVLRDLAAIGFQQANSPADLAEIFRDLRKRNIDMSTVLFYYPKFASPPALLPNGMLRLMGYFPTRPHHVEFDLVLEYERDEWRIFDVTIGTRQAPVSEPASNIPISESATPLDKGASASVPKAAPAPESKAAAPKDSKKDAAAKAGPPAPKKKAAEPAASPKEGAAQKPDPPSAAASSKESAEPPATP